MRFVSPMAALAAMATARRRKIQPTVTLPALFLLACLPVRAEDLVFPQGQFLNFSAVEKRSYARLDFPPALRQVLLWPARIVAAGTPGWVVPRAATRSIWTNAPPSIFVPAGDYNLVFTTLEPWPPGCANGMVSGSRSSCTANCYSIATLDPPEVSLPWKAAAGNRYEIKAQQVVQAPAPAVVWAGMGCLYHIANQPGYGVTDICLTDTSARHGTAAAPVCRSVRISLTGSSQDRAPAAKAPPLPAGPEPAWLTVTSTPPGAAVRVNDNVSGKTPTKLQLAAGDYTIAIELSGFTTWKRSLKLTSGSAISVDAELAPAAPPPPESPPAPPPHAKAAPPPGKPPNPTPAHTARNSFRRGAHEIS